MSGKEGMAQSVKSLSCSQDDLSSIPRIHKNKQEKMGVMRACNPNTRNIEARYLWGSLASQLRTQGEFQARVRIFLIKMKKWTVPKE